MWSFWSKIDWLKKSLHTSLYRRPLTTYCFLSKTFSTAKYFFECQNDGSSISTRRLISAPPLSVLKSTIFSFWRARTKKGNTELRFLCSACWLILINISYEVWKVFKLLLQSKHNQIAKSTIFSFKRPDFTPKIIGNPELQFLLSACRQMLVSNCVKFHEEWTG